MAAAFVEKNCATCKGRGNIEPEVPNETDPSRRLLCPDCKGWGTTVVKV